MQHAIGTLVCVKFVLHTFFCCLKFITIYRKFCLVFKTFFERVKFFSLFYYVRSSEGESMPYHVQCDIFPDQAQTFFLNTCNKKCCVCLSVIQSFRHFVIQSASYHLEILSKLYQIRYTSLSFGWLESLSSDFLNSQRRPSSWKEYSRGCFIYSGLRAAVFVLLHDIYFANVPLWWLPTRRALSFRPLRGFWDKFYLFCSLAAAVLVRRWLIFTVKCIFWIARDKSW